MGFKTEVFDGSFARSSAERIARELEHAGSIVLTGGTTAEKIYAELGTMNVSLSEIEVMFSDERCVPPDDPASNYGMAERLLLGPGGAERIHRMRGEDLPRVAADDYHREIAPVVDRGIDIVLLGMGADAHIGAMFPGSLALGERQKLCVPVDRPDGMKGLTLTPPAMLSGRKILLLVSGEPKAATVKRVIEGAESISSCPARLLAHHPDATFLLDEGAASQL